MNCILACRLYAIAMLQQLNKCTFVHPFVPDLSVCMLR